MLIVMTPLAGTGQVAAGCAAVAGAVLVRMRFHRLRAEVSGLIPMMGQQGITLTE